MKKLSKTEVETQSELLKDFEQKSSIVHEAYAAYVEAVATLNDAISDLNETVADLENHRQSIYDQMEEYFEDHSEKWQENETGVAYRDWMDEWSNVSLDPMEEMEEMPIDLPDVSLFEEISTEFNE